MDDDAKKKGKVTISTASSSPMQQQPHHSNAPPSSSSSSSTEPERELVQESKKLKQEDENKDTPPSPPSPRIPLSSIPPASHRQLYNNPHSGRPPRPQQTVRRPTTGPPPTTTTSGPISSAQQPKGYSNPAQLLLHVPDERARAKFRLDRQRAKKVTADWNGAGAGMIITQTRPARSPLGPGPDPYEKVIEVVSDVKEHLNRLKAMKLAAKKSLWSSSFSDPGSDSDSEPCSVEEVIRKLEKYLKSIPRTASAQEMEDKLLEFQIKVDVDPPPTWYALIKKSTKAFWDNLTDYFVVEALEDSDQEDDDDDMAVDDDPTDDKGGKGGSSSGSGFTKAT